MELTISLYLPQTFLERFSSRGLINVVHILYILSSPFLLRLVIEVQIVALPVSSDQFVKQDFF